jgi:hypothetical protein
MSDPEVPEAIERLCDEWSPWKERAAPRQSILSASGAAGLGARPLVMASSRASMANGLRMYATTPRYSAYALWRPGIARALTGDGDGIPANHRQRNTRMDQQQTAGRNCPARGSADYVFRGRTTVAAEAGQEQAAEPGQLGQGSLRHTLNTALSWQGP